MSPRRLLRVIAAAMSFAAAATCYGLGLAGQSGSWLAAMVASLAFLTLGFYLAGAGARASSIAS